MESPNSAITATGGGGEDAASPRPQAGRRRREGAGTVYGPLIRPHHSGWERLVRRTAYWGMMTVGQPTHQARMLPSFLIVGAERCGTSFMHEVIRQHPVVFNPVIPRKELHYFDVAYHRGPAWYQAHFPLRARANLVTRRAGAPPVAYEATPDYMFYPPCAERIHRDLPDVKLLVLVNDPVKRAYSGYRHRVGRGFEKETFERAIELEDARTAGEAERIAADPSYVSFNLRHYSYRAHGHYADQLERLERFFGRERIYVVDSGEFFADMHPVYDAVLDFLELPHRGYPSVAPQKSRPREPMPEAVRAELEEHYRPYDERLAAWLGREPSWRRKAAKRP
jgi:sulfotransferase family protein